jgi:hypothetical protein
MSSVNAYSFFTGLPPVLQQETQALDPTIASSIKNKSFTSDQLDKALMKVGKGFQLSPDAQAAESRFQSTGRTNDADVHSVLSCFK